MYVTVKKRYSLVDKFKRFLMFKFEKRYKRIKTQEFLKKIEAKRILVMDASPIMANMLRQRPHHFRDFWAKHFDVILYKSCFFDRPKLLKDNIYTVPYIPVDELKGKNVCYYIASAEGVNYKTFLKLKKNNYKIIYDYYDDSTVHLSKVITNSFVKNAIYVHKKMAKIKPEIVIASSRKLYDEIKQYCPNSKVMLVENGVTLEDFEIKSDFIPPDMQQILSEKKPVIGFYGCIGKWIDIDLINLIAQRCPQYNIILIGNLRDDVEPTYKIYNNIHFLGHKNYEDLVNYSKHFDCAIIPFVKGRIAQATSPNKLFEYMAMGIPTVCTRDLSECRNYNGVLMSEDDEEFISNLHKAIELSKDKNIREKLKLYAQQNTWEVKANKIFEKMKEIM